MDRLTFLSKPYGAYHYRAVPSEDALLTHTDPGTPCGEYLRRFWQPVAVASDLKDVPIRIRIMGEDLVVFRDGSGRVGLLQLHCSHRGTSLEFGLVSARGLTCCYHGWVFDVDGTILETPGEPADSTLKNRLCHGAYPTHEFGGLVFAYMGPPDKKPAFPRYANCDVPGFRLVVNLNAVWPCNWLQVKENAMDPVHTAFLHTIVSGAQFTAEHGVVPELEFLETPRGLIYIATRRVDDNVWVRISELFAPTMHQFPHDFEDGKQERTTAVPEATVWTVPVDDTHSLKLGFAHVSETERLNVPGATYNAAGDYLGVIFGESGDRPYEARQRQPGDYDAQVSQRPIAVHALEHLGTTDRGVIMFRKLLRREIQAVSQGADPGALADGSPGVIPTYARNTVLRVPPASTPEADRELMKRIGRETAARHALSSQDVHAQIPSAGGS